MFVVTDDGEVRAYICNQSCCLFKDGGSEDSLHSRSKLEGQARSYFSQVMEIYLEIPVRA